MGLDIKNIKLGTQIKLKDGRIGTVVYNDLIKIGIKWEKNSHGVVNFLKPWGNFEKMQIK